MRLTQVNPLEESGKGEKGIKTLLASAQGPAILFEY